LPPLILEHGDGYLKNRRYYGMISGYGGLAPIGMNGSNTQINPPGIWQTVRLAISGKEQDFTRGSIGRAIVLLSIPMILEMVLESVFAVTDVFFVSKLGVDAVATVGFTEAMITIVYAIACGMSMATTAMVARRIGEKNIQGARVAAIQAIALGIGASIPIVLLWAWSFPRICCASWADHPSS